MFAQLLAQEAQQEKLQGPTRLVAYPQKGFHSQAGWIAFSAVAVGFCFAVQRIPWFTRVHNRESLGSATPTAVFLMPFLMILTAEIKQDGRPNGRFASICHRMCTTHEHKERLSNEDGLWKRRRGRLGPSKSELAQVTVCFGNEIALRRAMYGTWNLLW